MPNRTIYVADSDLAVFDAAQRLAGDSLSSTIAHALREYVRLEEAHRKGFEPIEVRVGQNGAYVRKRFAGRPLGKVRRRDPEYNRLSRLVVYQTAGGRYAVHVRISPDWSHWQETDTSIGDAVDWWEGESRLDIYEDRDTLRAAIPPDLWAAVAQGLNGDEVEELDI